MLRSPAHCSRKHYKEIPGTNSQWAANLKKNEVIVGNAASKEITFMERMKPTIKPWKDQAGKTTFKRREIQSINVQR